MLPGLVLGASRTEVEPLAAIVEASPSLPADGLWVLVMAVEHAARRWMTAHMEPGEQSVGAQVSAERLGPAGPGTVLHSTATLTAIRGRRYVFEVEVRDALGRVVARGENERAVIPVPGG
jgi:predicted thioesterase